MEIFCLTRDKYSKKVIKSKTVYEVSKKKLIKRNFQNNVEYY